MITNSELASSATSDNRRVRAVARDVRRPAESGPPRTAPMAREHRAPDYRVQPISIATLAPLAAKIPTLARRAVVRADEGRQAATPQLRRHAALFLALSMSRATSTIMSSCPPT